jgi:hypothetical protein
MSVKGRGDRKASSRKRLGAGGNRKATREPRAHGLASGD